MKRMKSNEVRVDWADVLQFVRTGGTVVVEHYNKAVATITPYQENEPTWFASCPADNCDHGEVSITEWRNDDLSVVAAGSCDSCGQESVQCMECESLTVLFDGDETECDGCDAVYQKVEDRKGLTSTFRRIR